MPVAVYAPNVNRLYVMGGQGTGAGATYNINRVYDLTSGSWNLGAPMPEGRSFAMAEYYNGKIYVIGGYAEGVVTSARTQVWEYDPITNAWDTTRATMPNALGGAGHGIIDGKIYVAGGRASNNTVVNTVYAYDVATNSWTTRTPLPSPNNGPGSAVLAGKLWLFGGGNPFFGGLSVLPTTGKSAATQAPQATDALHLYDPVTNSWSIGPSLNLARSFPGGSAVGSIVVAWGGNTGGMTTNSIEVNRTIDGACLSPTPTATPTPSPPGCNEWVRWPSPAGERLANTFYGVAAASPDEVWAVGDQSDYYNVNPHVMIDRWDGTAWSLFPISMTGNLRGVAVAGPDDVWAVGNTVDAPLRTLTMHWNGAAWSTIPSPNAPNLNNNLYSVAAASSNDVWAVGSAGSNPLALRWNGSQWNIVPTPQIEWGVLRGVAVAGANNLWAVGSAGYGSRGETLVLHWNGSLWSRVYSPNSGLYTNGLQAISVVTPNNIWAAGWSSDDPYSYGYRGTMLHWNGIDWSNASISGPDSATIPSSYQLFGITMASSSEGWAVGWGWQGSTKRNVFVRWDGSNWTRIEGISPSFHNNELYGVTSVAAGEAWGVGTLRRETTSYYDPQILRYGPACVTPTPGVSVTATTAQSTGTPLPTSIATNTPVAVITSTSAATGTVVPSGTVEPTDTSVAATGTSVPPSSTPTITDTAIVATPTGAMTATPEVTPEACTIYFSDVISGDAFYTPIMCLACHGVLTGYADGTFRPGNSITRGQLAKVVSNAAGFRESVTLDPRFEDVPPDNPFYVYIERVASRGVIGGYSCGGLGEPCGVENRPYFRPGASATRGQIAKIVSNAANMNDIPLEQLFEDVPPYHTFYLWIERLAMHHMISGYPCGGPSEPCGANNSPYFRSANSATRGQVSKILANTFFPGCQTPRR
jgi:N-acetylneuraminic acid mutarotase